MSYVFEIEDEIVWSPALGVGTIYVAFVQSLEHVTGSQAGFEIVANDMVSIDKEMLRDFVSGLLASIEQSRGNTIYRAELETIIGLSLVILERAGVEMPDGDAALEFVGIARRFAPRMPT